MNHYLNLSILLNLIFIILLILWEKVFRKQNKEISKYKKDIELHNKYFIVQETFINQLKKDLYKKELELKNKKETIKYLSDQNIILNDEAGNIEKYYSENSDAIKNDRIKKGTEKFLQILQTSK